MTLSGLSNGTKFTSRSNCKVPEELVCLESSKRGLKGSVNAAAAVEVIFFRCEDSDQDRDSDTSHKSGGKPFGCFVGIIRIS